jgi:hypothetical protein
MEFLMATIIAHIHKLIALGPVVHNRLKWNFCAAQLSEDLETGARPTS